MKWSFGSRFQGWSQGGDVQPGSTVLLAAVGALMEVQISS